MEENPPSSSGCDAPRKPRILLAASGSVAAVKFANLCHSFCEWAEVKAVATNTSLRFIDIRELPKNLILYTDEGEWLTWRRIGDAVLHIELRRWADIMIIAPLSANTLAKMGTPCSNKWHQAFWAHHGFTSAYCSVYFVLFLTSFPPMCQLIAGGLCDNLLTCIVRAWDYSKPLFVAPAMNTFMWTNPFTEKHIVLIDDLGVNLIPPVRTKLASGDYGNGAMAEPSLICTTVRILLAKKQP
ncbi:hypothetical protein M9H77_36117 [Catharanthus roseus]|uniref:Uncharacterized protein n=1 Tax=Catharanthus roseus TaxID=4058 RepID=A0ACB9ZT38_CATRO|nr:hypothetical protein M9H77_36117 [Catharanthus roseus]